MPMMVEMGHRRTALLVGLVVMTLVIAAGLFLRRAESTISVETAAAEARRHGFDAVVWRATPEERLRAQELSQRVRPGETVSIAGDGEVVVTRGHGHADLKQPLIITWLPSADAARQRVAADQPLLEGRLTTAERAGLPQGFDVRRVRESHACNLAVTAYDAIGDGEITERYAHLVAALRDRC